MKLCARGALRRHDTVHAVRPENNLCEAGALQHFFVHFFVAGVAAALATCGVHHDFSRGFAGRWVKAQGAALHRKRSMDSVKAAANAVMHGALLGVNRQDDFLSG
jgi:hypothetical protein